MKDQKVSKLVRAALLAALCFVLTKVVTVPAPTGYVNLGDCAVLLSAWMLDPLYGGLAAGVGVMLADVLSPYAFYAPGTFVVKFAMAASAALIFRALKSRGALPPGQPPTLPAQCGGDPPCGRRHRRGHYGSRLFCL